MYDREEKEQQEQVFHLRKVLKEAGDGKPAAFSFQKTINNEVAG
jgi:hypothetical protein